MQSGLNFINVFQDLGMGNDRRFNELHSMKMYPDFKMYPEFIVNLRMSGHCKWALRTLRNRL